MLNAAAPRERPDPLPPPPWEALRAHLLARAEALDQAGDGAGAAGLREAVEGWWSEQLDWNQRLAELLRVHHEINNALVGVSGNAQLLLMKPAGQQPGVKERLEVVLRESGRIEEAALRLRQVRGVFGGSAPAAS
ncbi:MAG TPA: hypothetical protein VEY91_08730 [Candidatus Limnocylindria bacterium]|nr:hypothetical protein [Candidatus Limnocylindria bacterium]